MILHVCTIFSNCSKNVSFDCVFFFLFVCHLFGEKNAETKAKDIGTTTGKCVYFCIWQAKEKNICRKDNETNNKNMTKMESNEKKEKDMQTVIFVIHRITMYQATNISKIIHSLDDIRVF